MTEDSDSISEEERSLFRPFTRESLVAIQARIDEEHAKQKELERKRAEGEVACFFEVPHLLKSRRNNLMSYRLKDQDGNYANWNVLLELFRLDSQSATRVCPRLKSEHISPDKFQKMNVRTAVQALSAFKENLKCDAINTANMFEKFNNSFDFLDSKSIYLANPYRNAIQKGNNVYNYLVQMKEFVNQLQFLDTSVTRRIHCLNGLYQSINAVLLLADEMFNKYESWIYICTNKVNQDIVENLFSHVRFKKRNPSVQEFSQIISKILSINLVYCSKYANCEEDDDELLKIDWSTVTAEDELAKRPECEENDLKLKSIHKEGTNQDEEIEDISSCLEFNKAEDLSLLSDNATRYFAGYVLYKIFSRSLQNCDNCKNICINTNDVISAPNEWLLLYRNYAKNTNFCSLCAPSEYFYEICKCNVKIFEETFPKLGYKENILKNLIEISKNENPAWFDIENSCYEHRTKIVTFFFLVLLRKKCSWEMDKIKNTSKTVITQSEKAHNRLAILKA